jgi:hypothetical protein
MIYSVRKTGFDLRRQSDGGEEKAIEVAVFD